jgi:hypothetical protein
MGIDLQELIFISIKIIDCYSIGENNQKQEETSGLFGVNRIQRSCCSLELESSWFLLSVGFKVQKE